MGTANSLRVSVQRDSNNKYLLAFTAYVCRFFTPSTEARRMLTSHICSTELLMLFQNNREKHNIDTDSLTDLEKDILEGKKSKKNI